MDKKTTEKIIENSKKYFICEECGLAYMEKEWADKCKVWCKKHKSCNIEIIRHSIMR